MFTVWSKDTRQVVVPARWEAWGANQRDIATMLGEGLFPEDGRVEDMVDRDWFFSEERIGESPDEARKR
jgi:hypothetical protein